MPDDKHPIADQFSDEEMEQLKRYGEALGGSTPFSDEVEKHLPKYEAHYAKMRAAQTGGSLVGVGPSEMEQTAIQQQGALQQQAATQGAVQATQAQAAQTPRIPPAAPSGPQGVSEPYPAQRGQEGPVKAPEAPGGE